MIPRLTHLNKTAGGKVEIVESKSASRSKLVGDEVTSLNNSSITSVNEVRDSSPRLLHMKEQFSSGDPDMIQSRQVPWQLKRELSFVGVCD